MASTTKIDYHSFSSRKLIALFDNAKKQRTKLQAEIKRTWAKINEIDERTALIAEALKAQESPSNRLLEAIAEVEDMKQNPNFYKGYSSGKEVIEACLND